MWSRILARRIQGRLGEPVALAITDNIQTMVSYARRDGAVSLRLHHMFLSAPPKVVDALTGYLEGDARASRTVDDFIEAHRYLIRRLPPRVRQQRLRIEPRGHRYDLQKIFDDLNRRFFRGEVKATVSWATAPRTRGPRGSIKLGSYSEETRIIRIHPVLDHPVVPRYFAEYVVFHEMLHVVEGARPGPWTAPSPHPGVPRPGARLPPPGPGPRLGAPAPRLASGLAAAAPLRGPLFPGAPARVGLGPCDACSSRCLSWPSASGPPAAVSRR